MALVEAPVVGHRQPSAVHAIQGMPQGMDSAFQHAGVSHIKLETGLFQHHPRKACLLHTFGCQVNIGPACEAVFQVPNRFAVSNEHQCVHVGEMTLLSQKKEYILK